MLRSERRKPLFIRSLHAHTWLNIFAITVKSDVHVKGDPAVTDRVTVVHEVTKFSLDYGFFF